MNYEQIINFSEIHIYEPVKKFFTLLEKKWIGDKGKQLLCVCCNDCFSLRKGGPSKISGMCMFISLDLELKIGEYCNYDWDEFLETNFFTHQNSKACRRRQGWPGNIWDGEFSKLDPKL